MDLNKMVNDALTNIESSGFVEKKVQERLEKTIEGIVEDMFREYSDFGKDLKEKVKAELQINLDELHLEIYNVLILKAVAEKVNQTVRLQGIEQLKQGLDEMLTIEKKDVKLSDLIEKLKEESLEWDDDLRGKELSLHIDKKQYLSFIYIDEKPDKCNYECSYHITVREDGTIFNVKIKDQEISKSLIMSGMRGFEEELFKMYAAGSKLIIDEDDVDTYYWEDCD